METQVQLAEYQTKQAAGASYKSYPQYLLDKIEEEFAEVTARIEYRTFRRKALWSLEGFVVICLVVSIWMAFI